MNRGSGAGLADRGVGDERFNEAPIHESGKCQEGFGNPHSFEASMRPRFMNRGSASITIDDGLPEPELQ